MRFNNQDTVSNIISTIYSKCLLLSSNIEVHKIVRCSHLISLYFSKTMVEKKRIVDIYLLKIFLVELMVPLLVFGRVVLN